MPYITASFGNLLQTFFFRPSEKKINFWREIIKKYENNQPLTVFGHINFLIEFVCSAWEKPHRKKWIIKKASKIIEWKIQSTIRNHCRGKLKNNFVSQTSNVNISEEKSLTAWKSTHFRPFFGFKWENIPVAEGWIEGKLIDTRQARKKLIEWVNRSIVIKLWKALTLTFLSDFFMLRHVHSGKACGIRKKGWSVLGE